MKGKNILEIRQNGLELVIEGIIPTLSKSDELYSKEKKIFFKEVIAPKAFKNYIDVYGRNSISLLIDHNKSTPLRREWLKMQETEKGLEFTAKIFPTMKQKELLSLGAKGLSFGFVAGANKFVTDTTETQKLRVLESFKELTEISIIVKQTPAYPSTKVILDNNLELLERDRLKQIINKLKVNSYRQQLNSIR